MPGGKKPIPGGSAKDNRMYEDIKEDAEKSGRYGDRAKEVAARVVNARRSKEGRTKESKD